MLNFLAMFLSADKVGGYTRSAVAGGFAMMIAKWPWLSQYVDSTTQAEIGVAVAGVVVGIWSHVAKNIRNNSLPQITRSGGALGVFLIACAMATSVHAQTAPQKLPVKAPPKVVSDCTVNACKKWYYFADITGHATNVDFIGNGIGGSLMAGGATPHVGVGGFSWNGTYAYGVEAACGYSFNVSGPGVSGYDCYQEFQVGGNLGALFNITPATVPSGITAALMYPYVAVGPEESGTMKTGWRAGASVKFMLDANTFLDLGYRAVNGGNQSTIISSSAKSVVNTDNQTYVKVQMAF